MAADDTEFLTDTCLGTVSRLVQGSNFSKLHSAWDSGKAAVELPKKLVETAEGISEAVELIGEMTKQDLSLRFLKENDLYALAPPRLGAWADEMQGLADAMDVAKIIVSTCEVANRSSAWSQSFLDQMEVLTHVDKAVYGDSAQFVRKVAGKLIKEYQKPGEAATEEAVGGTTTTGMLRHCCGRIWRPVRFRCCISTNKQAFQKKTLVNLGRL